MKSPKVVIHVHRPEPSTLQIPDEFERLQVLMKACWAAARIMSPFLAEWVEVLRIYFPLSSHVTVVDNWEFRIYAVMADPLDDKKKLPDSIVCAGYLRDVQPGSDHSKFVRGILTDIRRILSAHIGTQESLVEDRKSKLNYGEPHPVIPG